MFKRKCYGRAFTYWIACRIYMLYSNVNPIETFFIIHPEVNVISKEMYSVLARLPLMNERLRAHV